MKTTAPKTFFKADGKALKSLLSQKQLSSQITSLFDESIVANRSDTNFFTSKARKIVLWCSKVGLSIDSTLERVTKQIKVSMFSPKKAVIWVSGSLSAFSLLATMLLISPLTGSVSKGFDYYIFSSKPLTIEQTSSDVYSRDARSQKINEVFKKYKCPLEGMGEVFVHEADKNNIPYWLVAAVSFQESGCGKKTPETDGVESYNAWGWGVWGDNKHGFDNWARGIETVSKYFGDRFYSQGYTDTCEIMKVYTPPSNGSWCRGVNYFGDEIMNFSSEGDLASGGGANKSADKASVVKNEVVAGDSDSE